MKYSLISALLLAPAALAQSSSMESAAASASASASASMTSGNSSDSGAYLTAVLGALTAANLTGLVGVASAIANTTDGMALLSQLAMGNNKTVFAPSNEAFAAVPSEVSSNTTLLTEILAYHILNNTYSVNGTMVAPNHTIARTLLKGGGYTLPGNRSAPLVLSRNSSDAMSFDINEATMNVTAMGPALAANLAVYIIDEVLSLPPNISAAAGELFPSLAGVIQSSGLLDPLEAAEGLTIFAPNDAAISGIMSALGTLNATQIQTVLANHVINGSVVYSTELMSSNYTSAAGEPFTFMSNSSGAYVMSANSTAKIVQSDIIVQNGVVHVIDGVLVNTNSNPEAAASAYSSGTAAAATQTEPTAPVTNTSPAATASGSSGTTGAGYRLSPFGFTGSMIGGAVAVLGAVVGGGWVLM